VSRGRSNACNPLALRIDKNLGNPVVKQVWVHTLADRRWIRLLSVNKTHGPFTPCHQHKDLAHQRWSNQRWSFPFVRGWTDESWIQCGISRHQLSQSRRLISQGRDWAYDIVGDCPGKRGRCCILQRMARILISKEGCDWKKGKISLLPLKLDESQALVQDREDALAH
jgi:hypothetical protein